MRIGYARVSKADGSQTTDLQRDALRAAGVLGGTPLRRSRIGDERRPPRPAGLPQGAARGRRAGGVGSWTGRAATCATWSRPPRPRRARDRPEGADRTRGSHRHHHLARAIRLHPVRRPGGVSSGI